MIFCMLKNRANGRWHPIFFRPAPMPSGADRDSQACRYRSSGHHTEGFETEPEARTYITEAIERHKDEGWRSEPTTWEWDGTGVPAMVEWFADA